jgi:hypothetical protein
MMTSRPPTRYHRVRLDAGTGGPNAGLGDDAGSMTSPSTIVGEGNVTVTRTTRALQ